MASSESFDDFSTDALFLCGGGDGKDGNHKNAKSDSIPPGFVEIFFMAFCFFHVCLSVETCHWDIVVSFLDNPFFRNGSKKTLTSGVNEVFTSEIASFWIGVFAGGFYV